MRKKKSCRIASGVVAGWLLVAAGVSPSDVAATDKRARLGVVDAAIEYHGGSRFEHSSTRFEVCSKSWCSAVTATMDGGLFEYEVSATVRGAPRRVRSTNNDVELWEDGRPVELGDPDRRQALRDWAMQRVYFNFLPFRLNDPSVYKQDLGTDTWDGRELRKIKVTFEPGTSTDASDEFLYWFDPETSRLELFAYSYEVNGGGLRFRQLSNYRRVGGLLFYDQENWGVEGPSLTVDMVTPGYVENVMRHVSTIELREISVEPVE